ncbi:MAG: hypothetical protein AB7O77_07335 [Phycisphaerales bacterium]
MLALGLAIIHPLVWHSGALPMHDQSDHAALRARAWVRVLSIRDESIRSYIAMERVTTLAPDGRLLPTLECEVRTDEFRNVRVLGKQRFYDPRTYDLVATQQVELSLHDGVQRTMAPELRSGVARPEKPSEIWHWTYPSVHTGLGRSVNLQQLRRRADHLQDCEDLRVTAESDTEVTLVGTGLVDTRRFKHRVTLDSRTGDVRRHEVIDMTWDTLFVDWAMTAWTEVDGCRVPSRVEYRVHENALTRPDLAELGRRVKGAGLSSDCQSPESRSYPEWCRIRDEYFRDGGVPTRLAAPPQVCDISYVQINTTPTESWFVLPSAAQADEFMSAALEIQVDRLELEPTGPKAEGAGERQP